MMKVRKLIGLPIFAILLSSCSALNPFFPSNSGSNSSSKSTRSTSISTSHPGDDEKVQLEHNMKEYISHNCYDFSSSPYSGNVNSLVIPVWFTNSSSFITSNTKKQNVLDDIKDVFNKSDKDLGWYSVSSYYETESLSSLKLSGVVSGWYECGNNYTYYATSSDRTSTLVESATNWYFSTTGENRKKYDADGDGYIDSVTLIYGCPNYRSLGNEDYDNLWAYTSWLLNPANKNEANPGPNVFMWASYDFMYGSNKSSDRTGSSYYSGDTRFTSLDSHTYIHEFGHVLGLEDYYDYSDYEYQPAAAFSMQDCNVGGHDPYSTLVFGWSKVFMPSKSITLTINDFQSSHDLILLANHDVTSVFDEYMLLELYTPTKLNELDSRESYQSRYPTGPNVPGIRLWHVDSRLLYLNSPTPSASNMTTDPTKPCSYGVYLAFANSYGGSNSSMLGSSYYDYNLLQCIRNSVTETYKPKSDLTNNYLFRESQSYSQEDFSRQFKKGTKLNDGKEFNWSFEVLLIEDNQATIKLVKEGE